MLVSCHRIVINVVKGTVQYLQSMSTMQLDLSLIIYVKLSLKGTVSRDFFALVFFLNLFILVLLEMP